MKRKEILNKLKKSLDAERYEHSLRVEKIAQRLAKTHRVSLKKASLAGLLHDIGRKFKRQGLLKEARHIGLRIDAIKKFEPKLLHAEISAYLARKEYKVKDREVLRAIASHTVGLPAMSKLEKIAYLADHIEEERNFPGIKKVRKLAYQDLDRAVVASIELMLKYLLDKELPVYEGMVRVRNYYLLKKKNA